VPWLLVRVCYREEDTSRGSIRAPPGGPCGASSRPRPADPATWFSGARPGRSVGPQCASELVKAAREAFKSIPESCGGRSKARLLDSATVRQ
jgi:hypothetical protein